MALIVCLNWELGELKFDFNSFNLKKNIALQHTENLYNIASSYEYEP